MSRRILSVFLTVILAIAMLPAQAEVKDTINQRLVFGASTASPYHHFSLVDLQWQIDVYEPLVWLDDSTGIYEPRIAESWEVSEDGLTYTFHLRDDVVFHNGEKLTAADCVFSYEFAKTAPQITMFTSVYDTVEALDDTTFVVHLDQVYYPFLHHSTMVRIVSQKAVEEQGEDFGTKTVLAGTGPYYIVDYNPAVKVELKAFKDYYRGAPVVENVNYVVITDASAAVIAFEKGEIDFLEVPASYYSELKDNDAYTSKDVQRHQLYYLCVNMNSLEADSVLNNKNVRKAIAYCVDKEGMVEVAREGLGTPANQIVMPQFTAGAPKETVVYDYDIEKAKECLVEAGYPEGVYVGTMLTQASDEIPKMAQVLQESCAQAGILFDIEQMEITAVFTAMRQGDYSMGFLASLMMLDYDYTSRFFHTKNDASAWVKYKDRDGIDWQRIDEVYDTAAATREEDARSELYTDGEGIVLDSATFLPLYFTKCGYVWQKDLVFDDSKLGPFFLFSTYEWTWK